MKDQLVVIIFITATVGLLVYALVRPWAETWAERIKERRMYMPIQAGNDGNRDGADES
jgi:uncharacterized protein YqhQ